MTSEQKLSAAAGLVLITGVTIALHKATVANGAKLGMTPPLAVGLVAVGAYAVPRMVTAR